MYICICNVYTDKDIRNTVEQHGLCDAEKVYQCLGAGFCCGKCSEAAQDVIDDTLFQTSMAIAAE